MKKEMVVRRRNRLNARAVAYQVAAAHLRVVESPNALEVQEMNRLAAKLDNEADKALKQRPPRCRLLPYNQWCDHNATQFIRHTCEGPGQLLLPA